MEPMYSNKTRGEKGEPGERGLPGPQGNPGPAGQDGSNGFGTEAQYNAIIVRLEALENPEV